VGLGGGTETRRVRIRGREREREKEIEREREVERKGKRFGESFKDNQKPEKKSTNQNHWGHNKNQLMSVIPKTSRRGGKKDITRGRDAVRVPTYLCVCVGVRWGKGTKDWH
jgi:hypothetical protein